MYFFKYGLGGEWKMQRLALVSVLLPALPLVLPQALFPFPLHI